MKYEAIVYVLERVSIHVIVDWNIKEVGILLFPHSGRVGLLSWRVSTRITNEKIVRAASFGPCNAFA